MGEDQSVSLIPAELVPWVVGAVAALAVLYVVWRILRRSRQQPLPEEPDLTLDVAALGEAGPPHGLPALEYYHIPVRLAALVLAPAGRGGYIPPAERAGDTLDALVPGLSQVMERHRPLLRFWPPQLSPRGFAHAFFANVRLPGDGGKGTHWCSLAGVFKVRGQPIMAGLVLRTSAPTDFGQTIVEQETKWLDVLRIRRS